MAPMKTKENELSDYDRLMEVIQKTKQKYEFNIYIQVNDAINKIISESSDGIAKLETLICKFEAENTNDSFNANLALAYVVVSFNMGFLTNIFNVSENKQIFSMISWGIATAATVMFAYAWRQHKLEQNRVFILNLLKFRHEELKNKKVLDQKTEEKETSKKKGLQKIDGVV